MYRECSRCHRPFNLPSFFSTCPTGTRCNACERKNLDEKAKRALKRSAPPPPPKGGIDISDSSLDEAEASSEEEELAKKPKVDEAKPGPSGPATKRTPKKRNGTKKSAEQVTAEQVTVIQEKEVTCATEPPSPPPSMSLDSEEVKSGKHKFRGFVPLYF